MALVLGPRADPQHRRGHPHARRGAQPVLGENLEIRRVEGPLAKPVQEHRVGDELGMLLPFQHVLADGGGEMRGTGLGMLGAVAIEQIDQVIEILRPIARGRVLRLLDGKVDRAPRRLQRGKRAGVQLVGELVAQRVVLDRGHLASLGSSSPKPTSPLPEVKKISPSLSAP